MICEIADLLIRLKFKNSRNIKKIVTFAVPKKWKNGEVSEWPNEQAWKVCILARVSRVRIPPSPLKGTNWFYYLFVPFYFCLNPHSSLLLLKICYLLLGFEIHQFACHILFLQDKPIFANFLLHYSFWNSMF